MVVGVWDGDIGVTVGQTESFIIILDVCSVALMSIPLMPHTLMMFVSRVVFGEVLVHAVEFGLVPMT